MKSLYLQGKFSEHPTIQLPISFFFKKKSWCKIQKIILNPFFSFEGFWSYISENIPSKCPFIPG